MEESSDESNGPGWFGVPKGQSNRFLVDHLVTEGQSGQDEHPKMKSQPREAEKYQTPGQEVTMEPESLTRQ